MEEGAERRQLQLRAKSEQDGPAFKLAADPRVTRVGRYLRRTCVDELPQLINVLRGEMSLVGPRPLPVNESLQCEIWQRRRLEVLPGLTCIWQLRGGREVKFADWMRMDLQYVAHRSPWFDLQLIVRTIAVALLHRGSV
jgi:lipopolysaccharide/colanic/teichoic acid biosynthesis glycosyltransferase